MLRIILHFYILCLTTHSALASGIGKVNVGNETTTTEIFSFNENYGDGSLPVFVTVDGASNDPQDISLRIFCELPVSGNGYTEVTFNPFDIVYPQEKIADIPFRIGGPGRQTLVQCWGEPVGTPPTDAPQFSKDVSIGQTGVFEIRPAGTVNFCDSLVVVPYSPDGGSFYLELSEAVEIGTVTVNCSQITGGGGVLNLNFPETIFFTIGEQRQQMRYTVVSDGSGPIEVGCVAQTVPVTGGQFLPDTSAGSSSFVQEEGTIVLQPSVTNLRSTDMTSFLVLDSPATEAITFYCSVSIADDLQDADVIINAPGCDQPTVPPNGTVPPEVTESMTFATTEISAPTVTGWQLLNGIIEIESGAVFAPIYLTKTGDDVYAQSERPELVTIRCCAPTGVPDKYTDEVTGLVAAAYLSPNYTTNWDEATSPSDEENERNTDPPEYVDLAQCPCDLTIDACDVDCCCDDACSSADTDQFTCIEGAEGGQKEDTPEYRCSASSYFDMKDWFPIMCVEFENSAFLGYFRQVEPATRSENEYDNKADDNRPHYTFEETVEDTQQEKPPEEVIDEEYYQAGEAVKAGLQVQNTLRMGPNYRLTLPGRTGAGECVFSSPIRYLHERDETCVWAMKDSFCSARSPLNALNYALPTRGGSALCSKGLLLLAQQEAAEVAFTNVDYLCAGDDADYYASYVRSTLTAREVYPRNGVKLFDYDLPNGGEDCEFDNTTGAYLCEALVIGGELPTAPLPPRCFWDDGNTDAPTPEIIDNVDSLMCNNAVLDVFYNFTWDGTEIMLLNATIILGNISYVNTSAIDPAMRTNNDTTFLTQLNKVTFTHNMNYSVWDDVETDINEDPTQDNITLPWTRDKYTRSGKEGYFDGLPVISGITVTTNDSDELVYMDTNLTSQLTMWGPGVDGLCENAGRAGVNFTQNAMGNCLLRIGPAELQDCNYLRKLILNRQDNLMRANYVALKGDPNPSSLTDWVQVLREDISGILEDDVIVNLNASDYVNDTTGICPNMPARIHVDIMWAMAGEHDGVHINDIVGARVSYTMETWSLRCSASSSPGCYGNTRWGAELGNDTVQSFTLQSSVAFMEVPPEEPASKTRYDAKRERDYNYCRYETCWGEAFYPWTAAYRGTDSEVVLGGSLAFLVFLIGLYAISRPWY